MDTAFAVVIVLLVALLIVFVLFYAVTRQDLWTISQRLRSIDAQQQVAVQRSGDSLRRERAAAHDQLAVLEAGLSTQPRDALTQEELDLFEDARRVIRACNNDLKRSKEWIGLPYDLEWAEVKQRLPQLVALYRQAVQQELKEEEAARPG